MKKQTDEKPLYEEIISQRANGTRRVQIAIHEPSLTQQHMKDQCDVNSILERYRKTGHFNHVSPSQGQYGDFSQFSDFRSSLDLVMGAKEAFDSLPAVVRQRFHNDPTKLVEFVIDPKNAEEAIALGLAVKSQDTQVPKNDDKTTINSAPTT